MASFHRTVFLGHDLALFLPDPNWQTAIKVVYRLAARVQEGGTGRENRTPKHYALRHELSAAFVLEKEKAAGLNETLYHLGETTTPEKRVYVGLPMAMDALPVARWAEKTHAAEWVLNYDESGYEIYAASEIPEEPAYALLAPLLVGRLENRPKLTALSDWDAGFTLKLLERSPWDFRIVPAPEGVTPAAWPALETDWSTRPFDWTEDGLSYHDIGAGRVEAIDGQEKAMRRGEEFTVAAASRSDVRKLINFFLARKGRTQAFTAPWLLVPGEDTVATPHSTKARFAEDFIEVEYSTDETARCRVKLLQVPWEIAPVAGETPVQEEECFFYRFWIDVPGGGFEWLFTDWEHDLVRDGKTWHGDTEAFFQHDKIEHAIDLSDAAVSLSSYIFPGNPLLLILQRQLDVPLRLQIAHGSPAAPNAAAIEYDGEIGDVHADGRTLSAETLVLGGQLEMKVPNFYFAKRCNYQLCGAGCNNGGAMPPAHWTFAGTITAVAGLQVTVTVTANPPAVDLVDDWLAKGWLKTGERDLFELKHVVRSQKLGAASQRLTLKKPLRSAGVGAAVTIFPYCSGTRAECIGKFGNYINVGAHFFIGATNLSLPSVNVTTTTGGKK